jgi:hypothetical protein
MILTYVLAFRWAHRAFIISDNFFLKAGLIGLRPVDFLEPGVTFFGADLPLHFAQRFFIAAEMRFRAAALMRRRFLTLAGLSLAPLGRTTPTCRLGTEAHKSCDCTFDTVSFLSELCYHALNVHVVLSLIVISGAVQMVIISLRKGLPATLQMLFWLALGSVLEVDRRETFSGVSYTVARL